MANVRDDVRRRQIEEALRHYREVRIKADEAAHAKAEAETALIELLEANQQKTASYREGDKVVRATYVRSETVQVDEPGLRKALGARRFDRYTVRKLDKHKLEEGMARGEVDPTTVSQYSEIKRSRPFVRFTEGAPKNGDSDETG